MQQLLSTFTPSEIVLFLILFIYAIKEVLTYKDFFKDRADKHINNKIKEKEANEEILESLKELSKQIGISQKQIEELDLKVRKLQESQDAKIASQERKIEQLIESDMDDIKSFIVGQYHKFVGQQHWIDDFSLDVIEKRYHIYTQEGGNSYAGNLMKELRELPKQPPKE